MNPLIEQVLTGNIDMEQFLKKLQDDPELQEYIRRLVPEEAKEDPSHVFWKSVSYPSVKRDHFDYYRFIFRMANSDLWASHPDIRIGKYLNIFSLLKKAYLYYYPDIVCTRRYEDVFDVYLDAVGDCFEGPEVCALVEQIILDTMQLSAKSKRVKQAHRPARCFPYRRQQASALDSGAGMADRKPQPYAVYRPKEGRGNRGLHISGRGHRGYTNHKAILLITRRTRKPKRQSLRGCL